MTNDNEPLRLAEILRGLCEGGGEEEGIDIYAPDYAPADGDVYVIRAAELLESHAQQAQQAPAAPFDHDAVVEANRQLLLQRSQVGLKKYGIGLDKAGLTRRQILQHQLEETLDLANYLQTEIMTLEAAAPCCEKTREQCAAICDDQADRARTTPGSARASACADRIRAANFVDGVAKDRKGD